MEYIIVDYSKNNKKYKRSDYIRVWFDENQLYFYINFGEYMDYFKKRENIYPVYMILLDDILSWCIQTFWKYYWSEWRFDLGYSDSKY